MYRDSSRCDWGWMLPLASAEIQTEMGLCLLDSSGPCLWTTPDLCQLLLMLRSTTMTYHALWNHGDGAKATLTRGAMVAAVEAEAAKPVALAPATAPAT